jgi:mutator protein MutT
LFLLYSHLQRIRFAAWKDQWWSAHQKVSDMTHHVVVAALIIQSDRILLGRRAEQRAFYPGVWDLFGGHVEPGEPPEQTLVRELQEEVGITPTSWTFLETIVESLPDQGDGTPDPPAGSLTAHLYLVTAWTGRPTNRQPEEHRIIGWFTLAQATHLPLADPIYPALFARYLGSGGYNSDKES